MCDCDLAIDNLVPMQMKKTKIDHPIGDAPFSLLVVGPSRCGKTNVILNLLTKWYSTAFDEVYLFSESAYQPSSGWLKMIEDGVIEEENVVDSYKTADSKIGSLIEQQKQMPKDQRRTVLVILDDMARESKKSTNLEALYTRGRHFNISTILLSQKFKDVASSNRNNATSVILYKPQQNMELDALTEAFAGLMPQNEFKNMLKEVTRQRFCFLFINQLEPDENKKFRKNFDTEIDVSV